MVKLEKKNLSRTIRDEGGEALGRALDKKGKIVTFPESIAPDLGLTPDQLRAMKPINQFPRRIGSN